VAVKAAALQPAGLRIKGSTSMKATSSNSGVATAASSAGRRRRSPGGRNNSTGRPQAREMALLARINNVEQGILTAKRLPLVLQAMQPLLAADVERHDPRRVENLWLAKTAKARVDHGGGFSPASRAVRSWRIRASRFSRLAGSGVSSGE
jgi:hypothetical protein